MRFTEIYPDPEDVVVFQRNYCFRQPHVSMAYTSKGSLSMGGTFIIFVVARGNVLSSMVTLERERSAIYPQSQGSQETEARLTRTIVNRERHTQ